MRTADYTIPTSANRNGRPAFPEDKPGELRRRVVELIAGMLDDYSGLASDQAKLFSAELRVETKKVRRAWWLYAFGVGLAVIGISILVVSLVPMLGHAFPDLPLWARMVMVGVVLMMAGGALLKLGRGSIQAAKPFPERSWNSLKENLACILNPRNESKNG